MAASNKRSVRFKQFYELGHKRCHYCCVQLNYVHGYKNSATVEHIIPKSQGGTLRKENCLVVCRKCNLSRGNKDFLGFIQKLPRKEWLINKYNQALKCYNHKVAA